jgi:hypothetical protein
MDMEQATMLDRVMLENIPHDTILNRGVLLDVCVTQLIMV